MIYEQQPLLCVNLGKVSRSFHTVFEVLLKESLYFEEDYSEVETFKPFFVKYKNRGQTLKSFSEFRKKTTLQNSLSWLQDVSCWNLRQFGWSWMEQVWFVWKCWQEKTLPFSPKKECGSILHSCIAASERTAGRLERPPPCRRAWWGACWLETLGGPGGDARGHQWFSSPVEDQAPFTLWLLKWVQAAESWVSLSSHSAASSCHLWF